MGIIASADLAYREGSSDKVYHIVLRDRDGGFSVDTQYGRRGSALNTGTKTPTPVERAAAQKIYDKLVNEKLAKGYRACDAGGEYVAPKDAGAESTLRPQLLNAVDANELAQLLADPRFVLQEKLDGVRVLLEVREHDDQALVGGTNRRGRTVALPKCVVGAAADAGSTFVVDGELVGHTFHAFDVLSIDGADVSSKPYRERLVELTCLLGGGDDPALRVVTTHHDADKEQARAELEARGAEGVVLKDLAAAYTAGRPASGGPQRKYKFYETASVEVVAVNAQRSVAVAVYDGATRIDVGNVTIPPNFPVPTPGSFAEVRYLYAYRGGSLYQPVYLGERDDSTREDCTLAQLKFKGEAA